MTIKMLRWNCPNDLHPGVLAPSRPRKDDIRRYCIPCSEKSGRLTERVSPVVEAKRSRGRERSAAKAAVKAAKKRAAVTQADLNRRFKSGYVAVVPWSSWPKKLLVEVRPSTNPRRPTWEIIREPKEGRGGKRILVIYDHGGDRFECEAQFATAVLQMYYNENAATVHKNLLRFWKVNVPMKNWPNITSDVAHGLRATEAITHFHDDLNERGSTKAKKKATTRTRSEAAVVGWRTRKKKARTAHANTHTYLS